MRVHRGHPRTWGAPPPGGSAVTIGVYDGVHTGHRTVLRRLVEEARRRQGRGPLVPTVLTFDRHPRHASPGGKLLTGLDRRIQLLADSGIERVGILPFDDIQALSAREFVHLVLVRGFRTRLLVVGHDFRFGHERRGNLDTLFQLGPRLGFRVQVIEAAFDEHGDRVSSTRIRDDLVRGQVEVAAARLGRPHELSGMVAGEERSRVRLGRYLVIPGCGAYLVDVEAGGTWATCSAVVNPQEGTADLSGLARGLPAGTTVRIRFRRRVPAPEFID